MEFIENETIFDLYVYAGVILGSIMVLMGLLYLFMSKREQSSDGKMRYSPYVKRMSAGAIWLGVIIAIPFANIGVIFMLIVKKIAEKHNNS